MIGFEIQGFDELQRQLEEASEAFAELDGEIAIVSFNPLDKASVYAAIIDTERAIDAKMGRFLDNELVANAVVELKEGYRDQIMARASEARAADNTAEGGLMVDQVIFRQIENTISDIRRSEYNTFSRHIKKLARIIHSPELEEINNELVRGINLQSWIAVGEATQASMVGSAVLEWPQEHTEELGTVILLIDMFALNPDQATGFAHTFYNNGSSDITSLLRNMTEQMFVPFSRDYINYVKQKTSTPEATLLPQKTEPAARKAFVVHGHDDGAREAVARFLERIGFEAVILHEQANQGRTVIEKIEAHGDVGFAVVLLTPDDMGGVKDGQQHPRARQNVLLELGYFIGRLGRSRVCALKRGEVEIPSDFGGVVYEPFDPAGAWKSALGRELQAAGFEIDWNKIMKP